MGIGSLCLSILTLCLLLPCAASGELRSLGDRDLAAVTGRAGISIDADIGMRVTVGSISISDSTPQRNTLVLGGVTIDDGSGGNFFLKTSDSGPNAIPTTIDVVSDASGTSTVFSDSSRINPRYYGIGSIIFAGQELGSLSIGPVREGPSTLRISAPAAGDGIGFDYSTRIGIGALRYGYNTTESLALNGIHIAGSMSGAPEDPSGWTESGDFHIGASAAEPDHRASLVVGTDQNSVTSTYLTLPLQGSLRVEEVSFGGTSFGPVAIDGINAHRLQIRFTP